MMHQHIGKYFLANFYTHSEGFLPSVFRHLPIYGFGMMRSDINLLPINN